MTYIYNNQPITRKGIVIDDAWHSYDYIVILSDAERETLEITVQAPPTPTPVSTEPQVPFEVTMRQARLTLSRAGLLNDINLAIQSMGEESKIEWEYATHVQRDSPLIEMVRQGKGLSEKDIDNLFISASQA